MHCQHALAPLAPETPISGRTVMTTAFKAYDWSSPPRHNFDTEQPSPQLTPARRSSKWDAAERHQSSDVHHTNLVVRTRTMSPSAGARHIGSPRAGGAPES
ncbi:hypothetical protein EVAR_103790_1 [Eumeta japonica]|uniref:Uncharacterized protein n=1 Tax=Eumeta variegata TaxID=151549 RepID=A0A4C1Z018_EUMVA|nr:hypothetical protein EVAR_103790_1 [Eumeta japonica]